MSEFELNDYLSILRRRKKYFITSALAIFLLSVIFALRWSNYRSTATIEIAPPEISAGATMPMGMNANDYNESLADLRISHLEQKVMSTASLITIITKFNLYPDAGKVTPVAEIAENMLGKIKIELVSGTLANPSTAQKASAFELSAIAFTLSFDYSDPLTAQKVTNELVSRFLDEDLKDRRNAAHETSVFLAAQIKALEASMDEQEKKIADFRAASGGIQPESLAFNQQAAQSILFNIQNIDSQITTNEGTQGSLRAQIASVDPYSRIIADGQVLTTPTIQLKALKAQYITLSAQYGPAHPDVIKVSRQIKALEKQIGSHTLETGDLQARINDTRANLAAAQKTYGPAHPDVITLQHQLSQLETQLADLARNPAADDAIKQDADNPAYLQIVAELKSMEEQHKSLMAQKNSLFAQQAKFQNAIAANPVAEQKLARLSRDYDNSQLRYRELKEKKMAADMSETIERDQSGQRLVVINPPEIPLHTRPARIQFIIGGFILAVMGGLASVVVAQVISQSIVGARHLKSVVGVAPLVTIPHIATVAEMNRQQREVEAPVQVKQMERPLPPGNVTISEALLEQNRIIAYQARNNKADLFRILRTRVLQTMSQSNFKTFAITSPNYGDGKTTLALNLAVSIALDLKQTILLADLDLRKPCIHRFLGLNPMFGLTDYLFYDTPLSDCMMRLPFDRMTTLPAGKQIEHSSEMLGSPKMAILAQELKSRYPDRFILYDMPPILAQDDPIAFLPHVDAVLLVVRDGVSRTYEIKHCLDILENANVIGTVLNNSV